MVGFSDDVDVVMLERRLEPRYSVEGLAEMIVLSGTGNTLISVAVVDISKNGFQIELARPVNIGAQVELRLRNSLVYAEIRNCRQLGPAKYRAGAKSQKVLDSPLTDRHIPDFSREFYAQESYTDAGRQMVADHLGVCSVCRAKIEKTARFLDEVRALRARA